jgi:hypothetical protein
MDTFRTAFACKVGNDMVRSGEAQISIW